MSSLNFRILPAPDALKDEVECFRLAEYSGGPGLALTVSMNGMPGLVFQHHDGRSPVENIVTPAGKSGPLPAAYIYGVSTYPGVMEHGPGPFTMTQVILKPHALQTLFGLNAAEMTGRLVELDEFTGEHLSIRLFDAASERERLALITNFLLRCIQSTQSKDRLVEESLKIIHSDIGTIKVRDLLKHLSLSERQFERRFVQAVGIGPQYYIRVKRFNEAVRLLKSGNYTRLTDIAYALNFHDQSHFIRDVKAFSGATPKGLAQVRHGYYHGAVGYTYLGK